ncbi:MAG: ATP-binding protein [Deltaproteobacteria bacterium]|nr:ATP-binding protein [Deltaproteobacteria bacterium]
MSIKKIPASPYKGLVPYSEEDEPFFFGRNGEREIITANLMASRLTLLYGASGVGKSSVLRAGVVPHLRQLAQQNLNEQGTPEFAVVVFSSVTIR